MKTLKQHQLERLQKIYRFYHQECYYFATKGSYEKRERTERLMFKYKL